MKGNVLITGSTSGIGYELSKIFASKGFNLILTGRNKEKLIEIKKELSLLNGINILTYDCDLSNKDNALELFNYIKSLNLNIDILVNNAGAGFNGDFNNISFNKHLSTIELNITSLTYLTYLVIKEMKERKSGKILNVASTGAYQPGPYIGVYYATKAYVLSFSEALREEVKEYGIVVTTLCPGATKTQFSKRAGKGDINVSMSAKKVGKSGYEGLMKNKAIIIPGTLNKLLVFLSKITPTSVNAKVVKQIQRKAMSKI